MYDPVYFVESRETPLVVVQIGELSRFIDSVGSAAFRLCTVWCVDESGQMATVRKEPRETL